MVIALHRGIALSLGRERKRHQLAPALAVGRVQVGLLADLALPRLGLVARDGEAVERR